MTREQLLLSLSLQPAADEDTEVQSGLALFSFSPQKRNLINEEMAEQHASMPDKMTFFDPSKKIQGNFFLSEFYFLRHN